MNGILCNYLKRFLSTFIVLVLGLANGLNVFSQEQRAESLLIFYINFSFSFSNIVVIYFYFYNFLSGSSITSKVRPTPKI